MNDDEFRLRLSDAADAFPLRGWSSDVQRRVVRRRAMTVGVALAVGVVAAAGVAVAVPVVTGWGPGPDRAGPPAATASADYVGSDWRLASVADGANSTTIPAAVGARMELLPDGRILIDDSVNALSGRFTKTADGFEVHDVATTFVAYDGRDPVRVAAIAALNTLACGNRDGLTPPGPVRDTVVSADGTRLVVQAGALRLTFERTGPATATRPDPPR
jgi:hypothetical protein